MIDCMVIGDSIAVGTSMHRKECVSYSKVGWNSWAWNKDYLSRATTKPYETIIISLGANDHNGIRTEYELRKMREAIKGQRVFWIDPGKERKPVPHEAIMKIASEYGDTILPRPKDHMSGDGVHPTGKGYKMLAEQTK
jgi:lysophospholipase L1-like esterase